jgi:hypothetical protein
MAPRRLVIILIALLVLSSIAAALAPVPPPGQRKTTSTTSTAVVPTPELDRPTGGRLVKAAVSVPPRTDGGAKSRKRSGRTAGRPTRIDLRAGDQLELRVRSPRVVTLELRGIGETVDAGPYSPGHLDVLFTRPGRYELAPLGEDEGDPVAVVVASRPGSAQ